MNIRNWSEEATPHPSRPSCGDGGLLVIYALLYALFGVVTGLRWAWAAVGRVLRDPHAVTTLLLVVLAVVAGKAVR